ncbi:MAG: hypothetical protein HRU23_15110 [Gammaproteobacteria bacterium]|nr:hypothetical protein [Gammaproteobacteria bacterium]
MASQCLVIKDCAQAAIDRGITDGMTNSAQDQGIWKSSFGCPLRHFGDYDRALRQMVRTIDVFKVNIFISTGGGGQFLPAKYRKVITPFKAAIKSGELIIANIDTTFLAQLEFLTEGLATLNVGQRPYEMGKRSAIVLKMLTDGEEVPKIINTGLTYCLPQTVKTCTQ